MKVRVYRKGEARKRAVSFDTSGWRFLPAENAHNRAEPTRWLPEYLEAEKRSKAPEQWCITISVPN
jgi:hypothetical protein